MAELQRISKGTQRDKRQKSTENEDQVESEA
jgi:hypothetical protein